MGTFPCTSPMGHVALLVIGIMAIPLNPRKLSLFVLRVRVRLSTTYVLSRWVVRFGIGFGPVGKLL